DDDDSEEGSMEESATRAPAIGSGDKDSQPHAELSVLGKENELSSVSILWDKMDTDDNSQCTTEGDSAEEYDYDDESMCWTDEENDQLAQDTKLKQVSFKWFTFFQEFDVTIEANTSPPRSDTCVVCAIWKASMPHFVEDLGDDTHLGHRLGLFAEFLHSHAAPKYNFYYSSDTKKIIIYCQLCRVMSRVTNADIATSSSGIWGL
ncbi:hypothetical protein DXG01_014988, partial [Tephrocybe rancida]